MWPIADDERFRPYVNVFDIDPRSRHLTPQIFLSSEAFASAVFLAQIVSDKVLICDFSLQRPHPWNIISPSGEWKWTLVDANRRTHVFWPRICRSSSPRGSGGSHSFLAPSPETWDTVSFLKNVIYRGLQLWDSPNDNDGCFPLGMGSGFWGMTGLRCLVRQLPHLAHKWPGVESGSSSSHSLYSIPDALTCHRQEGQHGSGVSHQLPGRLPVTHPEQACAPASS